MAYVGTPIDTTNQFQSLVGKRFNGDGSTTDFTLDVAPSSTLDIEVFVENVRQDPNSAYSLSGTTLTFAAAPPSGTNNIYVVHQAKAVGTISPAAGTVNADSFDNTVISGHDALTAIPDTTDELLISDGGTIKRIDFSLLGNAPAFAAKRDSTQGIANASWVKLQINTEDYDVGSAYDASTNYRFTVPSGKAGKYSFIGHVMLPGVDTNEYGAIAFYKNGSIITESQAREQKASDDRDTFVTCAYSLSLADGDYIELYAYQNSGATQNADYMHFSGFRLVGV